MLVPPGYTWALSHAAVPTILFAPEALLAKQWREQYLDGFYVGIPAGQAMDVLSGEISADTFVRNHRSRGLCA